VHEEHSDTPLNALELAATLSRHQVDYVAIGGVAMQVHGHVRTTRDFDVIAAWTPENMRRLAAALRELNARLRGVDADMLGIDVTDPEQLLKGGNFLMHTRHGDLDVFGADQTTAAPPYEQLHARAVAVDVRGVRLLIAHPEDLIRMKTAASGFRDRPPEKRRQDLDDIAVLEQLRHPNHTPPTPGGAAAAPPRRTPPRAERTPPGRQGPRRGLRP
jgi:hypothetical protein